MDRYLCNIEVEVEADSPEDAARQAGTMIDENTDPWIIGVLNVRTGASVEIDTAELEG